MRNRRASTPARAPLLATSLLVLLAACRRSAGVECDYAHPRCPADRVCAFVEAGRSACVPFGVEEAPLTAPFRPGQAFLCSQGGRSPAGRTHSFAGDLFAADLASSPDVPAAEVVSPVDAEAFVFDGCEERASGPEARNSSPCGLGYGNHVKLWDGKNIHLLGHLARVSVTDGRVRRGQVIGIQGVSGAAGPRHVHVTVTRPAPDDDVTTILKTPGYKGPIPVRVRYHVRGLNGAAATTWVDELSCAEGQPPTHVAF
ncbi:MAG: M23 family metallopeptidase [Minicystis sp.]